MGSDLTGKQLGPFRVEGPIGKGAMGTVYRAVHTTTGKPAAIKVMANSQPDPTQTARFEREIQLLAQFQHPNIVRIYGHSQDQGIRYYAMELVDGRSLEDILGDEGKLSLEQAITYGIQVCDALQELHAIGVIHRDLKPANLMVTADGLVKLTDFGIAKDVTAVSQAPLTDANRTVGTIAYMSPEQLAARNLTRKSDLYSLGLLLYRVLVGRLPFAGTSIFESMDQRMRGSFPLPSTADRTLPREIDELMDELLAPDPEDRPRDAYVVMQRLMDIQKKARDGVLTRAVATPTEALAPTVPVTPPVGPWRERWVRVSRSVRARTKSRRSARGARPPWRESTGVLLFGLVAIVGLTAYLLWPASPQERFERGRAMMQSESLYDWQVAMEECFEPLLAADPDGPYRAQIEEFRDRIAKKKAEGLARQSLVTGVIRVDASPAERSYVQARRMEADELPASAADRYRAIVRYYGEQAQERPWVLLAQDRLVDLARFADDQERAQAKRQEIERVLARAQDHERREELGRARELYSSIVELHRGDERVADLVARARQALGEAP